MTVDAICSTCAGGVAWYVAQGWRHVDDERSVVRDHAPQPFGGIAQAPVASLSYRESALVQAWADGVSTRKWAESCGISYLTARTYAARIREKFAGLGRAGVMAACFRAGVVT